MKLTVQKEVFQRFPQLQIGFILVNNLDNHTKLRESAHLLDQTVRLAQLTFNPDTLKTHHLISPWALARQEFGPAAQHYHTSVEQLLKKALAKKKISGKDVLTNLVYYLSLKHILPLSVDDADKIQGDLTFAIAARKKTTPALQPGELQYHDAHDILGTKLDYWKSRKTKLTAHSTTALIHLEVLPPVTTPKLNEVMKEVQLLVKNFCGGKLKMVILNKSKLSGTI